ncbi:PAN-3 domain-containing protein [Caenorhabditis elegans]|uniref:PAN-3 domain-containing protein n=1 Tax=Caenorhabditis elegans TaxID=6239 RepID=Q9GRV4_CAEEL|nr:PAN-3 domain-containing protein [Caenorhabditis elegans]CAC14421.1 PAN-3 domain-containing protein [Caenorhabditis elegans]|eukprot:NP_493431.1 C-type LECtin [Caenorhabditis elegans]
MLKFYLIMLILIFLETSIPYKMVLIYGTPEDVTMNPSPLTMDFDACVEYCYGLSACMMVSHAIGTQNCIAYEIGQVSTVRETDSGGSNKVAIKMNGTETAQCPLTAEENSMKFGAETANYTYREFDITVSNSLWTFTPVPACPKNFTMVTRPKGQWCIGVVPAKACITQKQGSSMCTKSYGNSILSGVENFEEYGLIQDLAQPHLTDLPSGAAGRSTVGFWINGDRKPICTGVNKTASCNGTNEFTFSDPTLSLNPTGYIWGVDQPSGTLAKDSLCVHYGFNSTTKQSIGVDDYSCTVSSTNGTCFIGYICGFRPS